MIGGTPWDQRSPEEAALLNPAFLALVLFHGVQGYEQETGHSMPFPLLFLVPPVVLVENTRRALPSRKDSSLAAWLQDHPSVRLRFAEVATSLVPVVRESLVFASSHGAVALEGGTISASRLPRGARVKLAGTTQDVQAILKNAQFVGRWYANAGTVETIMSLWGVRP